MAAQWANIEARTAAKRQFADLGVPLGELTLCAKIRHCLKPDFPAFEASRPTFTVLRPVLTRHSTDTRPSITRRYFRGGAAVVIPKPAFPIWLAPVRLSGDSHGRTLAARPGSLSGEARLDPNNECRSLEPALDQKRPTDRPGFISNEQRPTGCRAPFARCDGSSHARTSRTIFVCVSVARRTWVKPPSLRTLVNLASPACAPRP